MIKTTLTMDSLLFLGEEIIHKLDAKNIMDIERGYSRMNDILMNEIPKFVSILKQYKRQPEYFLNLLGDIMNHWGNFLSNDVKKDFKNYNQTFNYVKAMEIENQKKLMEYAMSHPANIKAQQEELDALADDLGDLFSSTSDITKSLNKMGLSSKDRPISKRKLPRKKQSFANLSLN